VQNIPVSAVPNQRFSVVLDGNSWDVTVRATDGVTAVSLARNGVLVIENLRAVAGMKIIPSEYEEAGNFAFFTANFELPDYRSFGVSQRLVYFSAAELAAIRAPKKPPITAARFNPIAALPLRFAPVGYVAA
jgi:hypothetical protein